MRSSLFMYLIIWLQIWLFKINTINLSASTCLREAGGGRGSLRARRIDSPSIERNRGSAQLLGGWGKGGGSCALSCVCYTCPPPIHRAWECGEGLGGQAVRAGLLPVGKASSRLPY